MGSEEREIDENIVTKEDSESVVSLNLKNLSIEFFVAKKMNFRTYLNKEL